jgi:succinate dehydrogenase / fumarate reductase cytochrome b subunit
MTASILHRATGAALYAGALILAGWAVALAAGPDAYGRYMDLLGSAVGRIVLFALTVSVFFHLANGVRHLAWDIGKGLSPASANLTAWAAFAFALSASVVLWAFLAFQGASV